MIVWAFGTAGHFLLTALWLKRADTAATRDELWFQTMVAGIGTLLIALHLMASTVGLSIPGVLLVLAAGHAFVGWQLYGRSNSAPLKGRPTTEPPSADVVTEPYVGRPLRGAELTNSTDIVTRTLELAAMVTLTAVVIQWAVLAMVNADVSGSDAAHYHVPNAVNMALGAGPFDLPPTSHLYPMGASTLAAWFILPVQTTLLTDLVMVVPFLLLVSAAGWLFRQLTSLSGLAWSTWMMLALFATPLFRSASLMSSDLLFAGATLAFGATVLTPLIQRQLKSADVWLISLSLGLLLGSKVTGIVVAGLIGTAAVIALATVWLKGNAKKKTIGAAKATPYVPSEATPYGSAWVWGGAALAVIGAGGIWLVRNWWVWGSPVAPNGVTLLGMTLFPGVAYEAGTYASVLGDMKETNNYRVWDRASYFINVWLSSWYLLSLSALAIIPIDAFVGRHRNRGVSLRLWAMLVACATGALMVWFLIGAPWTSLEWTRGTSLRYALPWLAILPLVAWVGLFPISLPWYRGTALAAIGGLAISVGGLAIFAKHQQPAFPPLLTPGVLFAAVAKETGSTAIAGGPRAEGEQVYDSVVAFEAKDGRSCDATGRRFFVTNRFDEAGALQGPWLRNQVFYAAREVRVTARVRPAMGPCDYIITERAIMDTDKGAALHAALNPSGTLVEVATVGDVVLLVHR